MSGVARGNLGGAIILLEKGFLSGEMGLSGEGILMFMFIFMLIVW